MIDFVVSLLFCVCNLLDEYSLFWCVGDLVLGFTWTVYSCAPCLWFMFDCFWVFEVCWGVRLGCLCVMYVWFVTFGLMGLAWKPDVVWYIARCFAWVESLVGYASWLLRGGRTDVVAGDWWCW